MIEIGNKKSQVDIKYPNFEGEDGGYYVPLVSDEGYLSWTPTQPDMPAVEMVNIIGPQGDRGADGESGVYIGETEPTSANLWVNPAELPDVIVSMEQVEALGYITESEVDEKLKDIEAGVVDLSNYYNKQEVDNKIEAIELLEGPQGPQGEKGETGANGADGYTPVKGTDYWTETDKTEIVSDVLAALPAAEGVSV